MSEECGTVGGEDKHVQGFARNTWRKETTWKT